MNLEGLPQGRMPWGKPVQPQLFLPLLFHILHLSGLYTWYNESAYKRSSIYKVLYKMNSF
jgi:hypothetical protein